MHNIMCKDEVGSIPERMYRQAVGHYLDTQSARRLLTNLSDTQWRTLLVDDQISLPKYVSMQNIRFVLPL